MGEWLKGRHPTVINRDAVQLESEVRRQIVYNIGFNDSRVHTRQEE